MGAAVEISTGNIDPVHLEGKRVMLGDVELGVLDGTSALVQYDIPAGKHVLCLREGLTTWGAVGFRVQSGHCAQISIGSTEGGVFSAIFGGWFALSRAGDHRIEPGAPGAEEISTDEVPADS